MGFAAFLILFPFLAAAVLIFTKNNSARKAVVFSSGIIIMAAAVLFSVREFPGSGNAYLGQSHLTHRIDNIMLAAELFLMALVVVLSVKHRKYYAGLLSVIGTAAMTWLEVSGRAATDEAHIYCDKLTVIMCLIIAFIGSLICIYAVGYMVDYHNHHTEYRDRRTFFFPMLFVFLGAMFGLVMSANLNWIYFFWEVTSISSFLLIGYTRTKKAIDNSFRALWMNLLGGLGFAAAIIYSAIMLDVTTLSGLVNHGTPSLILIPVILLAFAALTKSAQLPFSKWLLGAMVAPTPTSALLHSATMVKAGVYLLIRLAPAMHGELSGTMTSLVGGFTFLIASMLAITVSDGKKVLAYSTISNLGLITACAGVGTKETVWAAVLLLMFHAVSKSMMFQAVGAIENATGSRNIEDMHGLIMSAPFLAFVMVIGIAGMFLAPFGMLISKWAALKAFIDADNIVLVLFIAFGSATTMLYWTKWLAKILVCKAHSHKVYHRTAGGEWLSLLSHAFMMIMLCLLLPTISIAVVEPLLAQLYNVKSVSVLAPEDLVIMVIMLVMVFVIPVVARVLTSRINTTPNLEYMGGVNQGDDRHFEDSFGNPKNMYLSGWYLEDYFGEKKIWLPSAAISVVMIVAFIGLSVGTLSGGVI
ncbi:MAG: NADH-quinone oxidoreductase subunit L [Clostridia bacterium]|nr:NADH-quinone oxidoreductase subunit L [Clostridia bacterium]